MYDPRPSSALISSWIALCATVAFIIAAVSFHRDGVQAVLPHLINQLPFAVLFTAARLSSRTSNAPTTQAHIVLGAVAVALLGLAWWGYFGSDTSSGSFVPLIALFYGLLLALGVGGVCVMMTWPGRGE